MPLLNQVSPMDLAAFRKWVERPEWGLMIRHLATLENAARYEGAMQMKGVRFLETSEIPQSARIKLAEAAQYEIALKVLDELAKADSPLYAEVELNESRIPS